jgi:hypothetical protein
VRVKCRRPGIAVALVAGLAVSCASPLAPSVSAGESPTEKLVTAHFRILADRADAATLRAIADSLEAAYPRMTASLQSGEITGVSAWVWTDSADFYEAQGRNIGQSYPSDDG